MLCRVSACTEFGNAFFVGARRLVDRNRRVVRRRAVASVYFGTRCHWTVVLFFYLPTGNYLVTLLFVGASGSDNGEPPSFQLWIEFLAYLGSRFLRPRSRFTFCLLSLS